MNAIILKREIQLQLPVVKEKTFDDIDYFFLKSLKSLNY